MNRTIQERKRELGRQIAMARIEHGRTQDDLAGAINVSRATIINFETGKSNPDIFQLEDISDYLGEDLVFRLRRYRQPDLYRLQEADADLQAVEDDLVRIIRTETSPRVKRQLHFLFTGSHGRDPDAIIQECNAILQIPLRLGHSVAVMVDSLYHMTSAHGYLNCPEAVQPDLRLWEDAILHGFHAARSGRNSYTVDRDDDTL